MLFVHCLQSRAVTWTGISNLRPYLVSLPTSRQRTRIVTVGSRCFLWHYTVLMRTTESETAVYSYAFLTLGLVSTMSGCRIKFSTQLRQPCILRSIRSPLPGACNFHTVPMSRHFYRLSYLKAQFSRESVLDTIWKNFPTCGMWLR